MKFVFLLFVSLIAGSSIAASAGSPEKNEAKKISDFIFSDLFSNAEIPAAPLSDKVVILDLWASWCGPCAESLPFYGRLKEKYKTKGFEIIALSVDDDLEDAVKFAKPLKLPFLFAFDKGKKVSKALQVEAVPMTYIFDQKGTLVQTHRGFRKGDPQKIEDKIADLLKTE